MRGPSNHPTAAYFQMFPRHVLEHVVRGPPKDPDHVSGLATFHECTTIMFMDIVGFTSMSKEVQPDQVRGAGDHTCIEQTTW